MSRAIEKAAVWGIRAVIAFFAFLATWTAWIYRDKYAITIAVGAILLVVVSLLSGGCARIPKEWPAYVPDARVIDGDTLRVGLRLSVDRTEMRSLRFDCLDLEDGSVEDNFAADELRLMLERAKKMDVYDHNRRNGRKGDRDQWGRMIGHVLIDGYDPQVIVHGKGLGTWKCGE